MKGSSTINFITFASDNYLRNFMSLIDSIRQPILSELEIFKKTFADAFHSDNPILSSINEYVREGSGKQLRPIIALLSGKLCGEVNEGTYNAALSLELLHNASLIHDDVVDDTLERRGRESVNARWGNKIAVLSGDYMLSNALISATKTNNINILYSVSRIGMELSDGEIIQLVNTHQTKITEKEYFKVITKKTALLFATCCEVGALSVGLVGEKLKNLRNFGEYLGICFQIKDDIFDYHNDIEIGKPTGNDLRDGKITLPLIYALRNSEEEERKKVLDIIEKEDFTTENIELIMNFARDKGGLTYAEDRMQEYKDKAIKELECFDDSEVKRALVLCAEFASARKK